VVDDGVQGRLVDEALLHQQRFERLHPQRDVGRRLLLVVMVVMVVRHGGSVGPSRRPREDRA
jgi:hypothetical protein